MPLTLDDIRRARELIAGAAIRTPLVRLNVWDAPADIVLKLENLQPIGSFKIRGAATAMNMMSRAELAQGVLTASAGSMAQGVGWSTGRGLAIGIATALRALQRSVHSYAVEAASGAPFPASWKAGSPQVVDYRPSFVDGIGSKTVFADMLAMAKDLLDGSFTASLDETAAAVKLIAERNRVIAEGAGAVGLAVGLSGKAGTGPVACIVSGGNIDAAKLATILSKP